MRIFLQGKDESVVVNGNITVTVLDIDGDDVVLGIEVPAWMEIDGNEPSRLDDELEESSPLQPR